MNRFVRCLSAVLVAAMFLLLPPCASAGEATGSFDRTLKVTGVVDLDVATGAGKITVRTGAAGTVRVVAAIKARGGFFRSRSPEEKVRALEANPPIDQSGSFIRIGHIRDEELRREVFIDYELTVPADTSVRASTGLGDVHVDGVSGRVKASTGAGSIRLFSLSGEADGDTGLGDVEIRGARGRVRANSGAGSIRVEGEPLENWRLSTGLGDVRVRITGQKGFEVHASTGLGSINSSLPLTIQGSFASSEVHGKIRGGGPLLRISSGAGSIHID